MMGDEWVKEWAACLERQHGMADEARWRLYILHHGTLKRQL